MAGSERVFEPGRQYWHYEGNGTLAIVTMVNALQGIEWAVNVQVDSGIRKGQKIGVCKDTLYMFPEEKERLMAKISDDIENLEMMKKKVILWRVIE